MERIEQKTAVREIVEFFGDGPQRMFGSRHSPIAGSRMGVVICPGLQAEFSRNYRREVLLARGLASLGFCVQRFHYRGTGNSDGESSDITLSTMVEDALFSVDWMKRREGCELVAMVGARLGGLVAAAAAKHAPSTPLVLFEPFTESRIYFRDIFRAARISELEKGAGTGPSQEAQIEALRRSGTLDVLGYSIDLALYESVRNRRLEDELNGFLRPVLLVGIAPKGIVRNEQVRLVSRLQSLGFEVETHAIAMAQEPWWFVGGRSRDEEASLASELVRVTAAWIRRTSLTEGAVR